MNAVSSIRQTLTLIAALAMSMQSASVVATNESPLSGLVINQTGSYQAQSFYQAFCLEWHEQPNASQFNVVLKEVHSPRQGRQVRIMFDHKVAYVASLPNGKLPVHAIAEEAATQAIQRIQGLVLREATYRNPDLAVDEI